MWPWNLLDDLIKQQGTSSILHQALWIISNSSMQSYSPETLSSGQNWWFLSHMTLKFYGWPWKTIGHLFYTTSSFVHHSKATGGLKLELQSGNAQFGSKSAIVCPCNLEIWQMTLKHNRAPLLCCFKLCVSFHSRWWIQTGVTIQRRSIRVKIGNLLSRVTWNFYGWLWKTIGHLFYTTLSLVHHFKATDGLKLELQSGNAQFGSKSALFCPVWPGNLTDDLEK